MLGSIPFFHSSQLQESLGNQVSKEAPESSVKSTNEDSIVYPGVAAVSFQIEPSQMFPLIYNYEDVSRQDMLLKGDYANVMEIPGLSSIRVVPKAPSKAGKLAMEIPRAQKFIETQTGITPSRSNPFLGKDITDDLARQTTLRGQSMHTFLVRVSTVMSLLDFPIDIRKGSIHFSIQRELCELSPELEDHFEIFEHSPGFDVTLATSANTQDETLPLWTAFLQKDEG